MNQNASAAQMIEHLFEAQKTIEARSMNKDLVDYLKAGVEAYETLEQGLLIYRSNADPRGGVRPTLLGVPIQKCPEIEPRAIHGYNSEHECIYIDRF